VPLKLGAYTACPHDRPLAKAVEVLKADFRRGGPGKAGASRSGRRSARDMVTARIAIVRVLLTWLAVRLVRREGRDRRRRAGSQGRITWIRRRSLTCLVRKLQRRSRRQTPTQTRQL
jgi:hypothetical protein